jgi:hypothetical protein
MAIAAVVAAQKVVVVVVVAHMVGIGPGAAFHGLRAALRQPAPWQQQLLASMQALKQRGKKTKVSDG